MKQEYAGADLSHMLRGRQSLRFALDIGTQIPTADRVLESLRGFGSRQSSEKAGLGQRLEGKCLYLVSKSMMSLLYGQRRLWLRQYLGAEQLPHDLSQQSAGRLKNKLFIPAAGSAVV